MRIDISSDKDNRPGTIFRALIESLLGPHWEDYVTIYIQEQNHLTGIFFSKYALHNEDGPATVKQDGTMEWWLNGKKLFVKTQREFECYMKNKAFW